MTHPHICRHTYCTNMAKSGTSVKTLQYLMGHADIATTMNIYTHLKMEDTKDKLEQMKSKGAVKKGDDLGGHGVCQKGNKTSE